MTDISPEERVPRTLNQEFFRMEDDFDDARTMRRGLINKLTQAANNVVLVEDDGKGGVTVRDDTDTSVRLIGMALKALTESEKASNLAINVRLKQRELDQASSAAAKNRIAILLAHTAPGRIDTEFPVEELEQALETMFDSDIKDFELKDNPRDLT
jgi:hypothetical protein